jgi:trans-aconitate methyltransferase
LNDQSPRLYRELASWWPLLSRPSDYAQEASFFTTLFFEATDSPPQTLLELGSGGGNNASHLKVHFKLTLVDQSAQMLSVSRQLNPECEHITGDMRTVRLDRLFDAVFIHDAIDYMTTEADLRKAMETAYVHCQAGAMALFVPDHVRENFVTTTQQGGHDGVARALRYLEWSYDPDETDTAYVVDYAYLLREGEDEVKVAYDRHIVGLFERAAWLRLLAEVGFKARVVVDEFKRELFVAVKIVE